MVDDADAVMIDDVIEDQSSPQLDRRITQNVNPNTPVANPRSHGDVKIVEPTCGIVCGVEWNESDMLCRVILGTGTNKEFEDAVYLLGQILLVCSIQMSEVVEAGGLGQMLKGEWVSVLLEMPEKAGK